MSLQTTSSQDENGKGIKKGRVSKFNNSSDHQDPRYIQSVHEAYSTFYNFKMEELKNMYQNNTLETNQKIIASNWSEMSDEHKSLYFPHGSLEVQHEHHHHQQQQHPQVHQLQQHHHIQQQFQQVQQHQRHQQIQIPMHNGNNLNVHDVMSITLDHNSKAFMIFSTEKHDEVQSMYPRADYSELHNILTQTWNGLSQSEKMTYAMKQQAQHQSQLQLHSHPQQQILQQQHVPDNSATPFHIGKSIKKPKQAPSAYVLFCRDKRAEIKSQYPVAGIADQGRLLGQLWNSLDKDKKQEYHARSQAETVSFKSTLVVKAKSPVSPYITFCSLKRNEVKEQYPHATFGDIGRLLGGMWATLDPEEKLMYIQTANEKNQQILNYSTQEQEIKQQQIEQDLEQQQQLREQQQLQQQSESMSNIPTDVLNTNGTGNSYPNQLNVHLNQSSAIPVHDLQHPSSAAAMPESKIKTPSAYVNFCRAFRADVRDKYPGASISEQGRILGQMWSNTDENSRKQFLPKITDTEGSGYQIDPTPVVECPTKQTPSPYITFCTLKRTEVKSIFPEAGFSIMGKILGSLWAAMGDEGRGEFARVAQELATKNDFQKQLWMEKCKLPTAFSLFCDEHRIAIRNTCQPEASHVDIIKKFTSEWCILTPERRQEYIKRAEELEHAASLKKRRRSHSKHAPSAYMVFSEEKRIELSANQPGISFNDVGRILGKLWSETNEEGRVKYAEEAKRRGAMIVRPVPQSRPKPTASAYMMFCSSKRSEVQAANPAANFAELGKILGQMWASYTPDEKKIYVEQASLFKGQIKPDMITTSGDHSNIGSTHLSGSISSSNTGHGHHVLLDVSLDQLEQSEEEMGVSMDEHQEGLE